MDDFAAIAIYGERPADHIEQRAILVVLDPARLPARRIAKGDLLTVLAAESLPGEPDGEPRIAFRNATDGKQYWTLERAFTQACRPTR